MKVSCDKGALTRALLSNGRVFRPSDRGGIALVAGDDGLRLFSSDGLVSLSLLVDEAVVEERGRVAVSAKIFSEFVRELPQGEVALAEDGGVLRVRCGRHAANIRAMSEGTYSGERWGGEVGVYLLFDSERLARALDRVLFVVEKEKSVSDGAAFPGVGVFPLGDKVAFAAHDAFRLSVGMEQAQEMRWRTPEWRMVIPARALRGVRRMLPAGEQVGMSLFAGMVLFEAPRWRLSAGLVEREFPDIGRFLSMPYKTRVRVLREDLIRDVQMAALFADEVVARHGGSVRMVRVSVADGRVSLGGTYRPNGQGADGDDQGNVVASLGAEVEGGEYNGAFSADFLLGALRASDAEYILLLFGDSHEPLTIRPEVGGTFVHVIMPMSSL